MVHLTDSYDCFAVMGLDCRKKAEVIIPQIEQKLWDDGILGLHSSLLNAVFISMVKTFI